MGSFFDSVRSVFRTIVGVIKDPILYHVDINTEFGRGRFIIQIRQNEESKETYLLLILKGSEERIHLPIRKQYYSEFFGKVDDIKTKIEFNADWAIDSDGLPK